MFSRKRGGKSVATGEICLESGGWRAVETVGPHNSPPPRRARLSMSEAARAYDRRWREARAGGEEPHTSWTEPPAEQ